MGYWLLFSVIMAVASFVSHNFVRKFKKHKDWTISLAAGMLVAYLFLQLFPEIYRNTNQYGNAIFLAVLVGFVIFHFAEKMIYKYLKHDVCGGLEKLHVVIFFIYHVIVGILLVEFLKLNFLKGFFFFFSISVLLLTSSAVFEVFHERKKTTRIIERGLIAVAFVIGALIGNFFMINFVLLLGFVAGVLVYVIGREVLPKDRKGNPYFFLVGVILYAALLIYLNIFSFI